VTYLSVQTSKEYAYRKNGFIASAYYQKPGQREVIKNIKNRCHESDHNRHEIVHGCDSSLNLAAYLNEKKMDGPGASGKFFSGMQPVFNLIYPDERAIYCFACLVDGN